MATRKQAERTSALVHKGGAGTGQALAVNDPKAVGARIVAALAQGLEAAAEILRGYMESGGDMEELRRCSGLHWDVWVVLGRIAAGTLDPRLAVGCRPQLAKAIGALPLAEQEKAIEKGVEVLAQDGSSIRVPVKELTRDQMNQVCAPDHVRTPSEQAAYLKALTRRTILPPDPPLVKWEVLADKQILRVHVPVDLTVRDLHRILGQIV